MINNFYKGVSLSETSDPISRPAYYWKRASIDDTAITDVWPRYEALRPEQVEHCDRCGKQLEEHMSLATAYLGRVHYFTCHDCALALMEKLVRNEI